MIDRRKIGPILLLVGAGLATVASFQDTYGTVYPGFGGPEQKMTTTLWIVVRDPAFGEPPQDAYNAGGLPVIIAAALMVVAAVLLVRKRTSFVGTPAAMGAAGALAGIVLMYVLQVWREKELMAGMVLPDGQTAVLSFLGGTYVLVAAAVIGLVGAVLAQRGQPPEEAEEEVDEEAVVVHQLDDGDDTPPFGLAIPAEEQQQEAR